MTAFYLHVSATEVMAVCVPMLTQCVITYSSYACAFLSVMSQRVYHEKDSYSNIKLGVLFLLLLFFMSFMIQAKKYLLEKT